MRGLSKSEQKKKKKIGKILYLHVTKQLSIKNTLRIHNFYLIIRQSNLLLDPEGLQKSIK